MKWIYWLRQVLFLQRVASGVPSNQKPENQSSLDPQPKKKRKKKKNNNNNTTRLTNDTLTKSPPRPTKKMKLTAADFDCRLFSGWIVCFDQRHTHTHREREREREMNGGSDAITEG